MRKDYQKAARGSIYAIAVMIAGMCFSASPAQSSTCFLPSGNCVTGKIDTKQDGGNETIEYCNGFDISESKYNKKYNNTSCFSCTSCTRTSGGTFYKCETVNDTKWYDDYNVCCTDGTKYDKDDGKCCAGGKCDHPCSGGKQWSPTLKDCVCPSNVETDGKGNCCASGQVLDENKNCTTPCTMNDCGSYPYTTDPGNSEKCNLGCNKGTRYKCKSGYTYSGGKCVEQCAASGYTLTSAKNENCYSCTPCQYDTSKYKCTENVQSNYQLVNGVCSKKTTECTYTYFEATQSNTCGTTGNLDRNESCKTSTCCFKSLSKVESIDRGSGSPSVMPIYNKISNKSDSCVRNGTTYYETLCPGTPEGRCPSSKTFTPNGCVSSGYNHGYEVKGTRWGTCGCDTTSGQYDTADACRKATGKGCTSVNSCYRTCESQGYFSTEKACKENLPSGYKCASPGSAGNSNCYTRYQPGFAIRYASTPKRTWNCSPNGGGASIQQRFSAWLAKVTVSNGVHQPGTYAEALDGIAYGELSDNEHRYEAGTYFVCTSNGGAYSTAVVGIRKTVVQYTRSANEADPSRLVCFADTISSQLGNTECQKSTAWGAGYSCREVTFNEGGLYLVAIYGDNGYLGTTTNKYNCHNQ